MYSVQPSTKIAWIECVLFLRKRLVQNARSIYAHVLRYISRKTFLSYTQDNRYRLRGDFLLYRYSQWPKQSQLLSHAPEVDSKRITVQWGYLLPNVQPFKIHRYQYLLILDQRPCSAEVILGHETIQRLNAFKGLPFLRRNIVRRSSSLSLQVVLIHESFRARLQSTRAQSTSRAAVGVHSLSNCLQLKHFPLQYLSVSSRFIALCDLSVFLSTTSTTQHTPSSGMMMMLLTTDRRVLFLFLYDALEKIRCRCIARRKKLQNLSFWCLRIDGRVAILHSVVHVHR